MLNTYFEISISECSYYHLNKHMKPAVFNIKLPYLKIKLSGVSAYVSNIFYIKVGSTSTLIFERFQLYL